MSVETDTRFMRLALEQAAHAAELGEVPIGSVVVYEGEVIASGYNRREIDEDPAGHAEFLAMKEASKKLGHWRLSGCTVYVTLEPCLMCAGLMQQSRIDRCVYGASDPKAGALGTLYRINEDERLNHRFEVEAGVLQEDCAEMLKSFFAKLRTVR
jgi:tRNA(adenine34) deaminase